MWDLIVSVPDHCLSFYFVPYNKDKNAQCLIPIESRIVIDITFTDLLVRTRSNYFSLIARSN